MPSKQRKRIGNRATAPPTRGGGSAENFALLRVPLMPVSKKIVGQLYYESAIVMTVPANGNANNYFFSANGIYDPNVTGTGHQPTGFDQMMLFYEQYTVVKSRITVGFLPNYPSRCGVSLSPDTTSLTNPQQLMENGLVKAMHFAGLSSASEVNLRMQDVTLNCDVVSYFGRKTERELLDDDQLYGTTAGNPNEQVYFDVCVWQTNPDGSNTRSVTFDVLLAYDVIYWEPRKAAISLEELRMERLSKLSKKKAPEDELKKPPPGGKSTDKRYVLVEA
jgi:hypothetical protein